MSAREEDAEDAAGSAQHDLRRRPGKELQQERVPDEFSCSYADFGEDDLALLDAVADGPLSRIYARKPSQEHSFGVKSDVAEYIHGKLTIVVTTSPVISNPSTALLEHLIRSMGDVPGLRASAIIIMCDGYKVLQDTHRLHGKHTNKLGRVTEERAHQYEEFKRRLQFACAGSSTSEVDARRGSDEDDVFRNCIVVPMKQHHGFGYLVKASLKLVRTEFMMVAQHDWIFLRCVALTPTMVDVQAVPAVLLDSHCYFQAFPAVSRVKSDGGKSRHTQVGIVVLCTLRLEFELVIAVDSLQIRRTSLPERRRIPRQDAGTISTLRPAPTTAGTRASQLNRCCAHCHDFDGTKLRLSMLASTRQRSDTMCLLSPCCSGESTVHPCFSF